MHLRRKQSSEGAVARISRSRIVSTTRHLPQPTTTHHSLSNLSPAAPDSRFVFPMDHVNTDAVITLKMKQSKQSMEGNG